MNPNHFNTGFPDLDKLTGGFGRKRLVTFVGDRPEDQACAEAAGLDFQWAADWRSQA